MFYLHNKKKKNKWKYRNKIIMVKIKFKTIAVRTGGGWMTYTTQQSSLLKGNNN